MARRRSSAGAAAVAIAVLFGGLAYYSRHSRSSGRSPPHPAHYAPASPRTPSASPAAPAPGTDSFTGRVVGVSDGDTVTVLRDGAAVKVRLWGVDCPESHQAYGQQAKQFTSQMVYGKTVRVQGHDVDKYGRLVAEVAVDGSGGVSLNEALASSGMAWAYRHFSTQFVAQEESARAARRGLWADPHPTPPWSFRQARGPSGH